MQTGGGEPDGEEVHGSTFWLRLWRSRGARPPTEVNGPESRSKDCGACITMRHRRI